MQLVKKQDLQGNLSIMEPQNLFLYLGMNGRIKMAQENFIRRYLMKAGKMGHNGFQIGQTSTENPHALHISFSIENRHQKLPIQPRYKYGIYPLPISASSTRKIAQLNYRRDMPITLH